MTSLRSRHDRSAPAITASPHLRNSRAGALPSEPKDFWTAPTRPNQVESNQAFLISTRQALLGYDYW